MSAAAARISRHAAARSLRRTMLRMHAHNEMVEQARRPSRVVCACGRKLDSWWPGCHHHTRPARDRGIRWRRRCDRCDHLWDLDVVLLNRAWRADPGGVIRLPLRRESPRYRPTGRRG